MNIVQIQSKIKTLLKQMIFQSDSGEENSAYVFVKHSILGDELFLKHTLFEFYYECYKKISSSGTVLDVYKDNLNSNNDISIDIVNNKEYAKLKRTYTSYRNYNDNIAREHGLFDQVHLQKIKTVEERMKGHNVKEFQKNQLIHLYRFEIFKHLKNKTISNSKSITDFRLIKMLNEIKDIYISIEEENSTFFMRSFHYYQLEFNCRFEAYYYAALILSRSNKSLKQKKKDAEFFNCFSAVRSGEFYYQNRFVLGITKYVDRYIDDPDSTEIIPLEILHLSRIKRVLINAVFEEIKDYKAINFEEIEDFCEHFFGCRQHIVLDKNWNGIKLRHFRDMYSE